MRSSDEKFLLNALQIENYGAVVEFQGKIFR